MARGRTARGAVTWPAARALFAHRRGIRAIRQRQRCNHPAGDPSRLRGASTGALKVVRSPCSRSRLRHVISSRRVLQPRVRVWLGHPRRLSAEIVHQPRSRSRHLFGPRRIGARRWARLVRAPSMGGEHRADRDALQLACRHWVHRAVAQLGDTEQVECSSTRLRITSGASRVVSCRTQSSSSNVSVTQPGELTCQHATRRPARGRVGVRVVAPSTVNRPDKHAPVKCGTRPLMAPKQVRFCPHRFRRYNHNSTRPRESRDDIAQSSGRLRRDRLSTTPCSEAGIMRAIRSVPLETVSLVRSSGFCDRPTA